MKKLIILAIAATICAACSNQPVQQNKSFMDLARQRFAVREYAQTPVEQAKPSDNHFSCKPLSETVTYK